MRLHPLQRPRGRPQRHRARGGGGGGKKPRSQDSIEAVVFDDKSAVLLPHKPNEETGVMSKLNCAVNGQCDLVKETGNMYVSDSSNAGKNNDHVLNELALNTVMSGTGARMLFLLSDMGPLNHLALTVMFSMFLRDFGLYDMVFVAFLKRYHSKQLCDRM